jgi:hypothetical protein
MRANFREFLDELEGAIRYQATLVEKKRITKELHDETVVNMPRLRARLEPFLV